MNRSGSATSDVSRDDGNDPILHLEHMMTRFRLACKQVVLLHNQVEYLTIHNDRARNSCKRVFYLLLITNIVMLKHRRDLFHLYISELSEKLESFHRQLLRDGFLKLDLFPIDGDE